MSRHFRRTKDYGRFAGIAGSIRFDARELHYLAPLFGLFGDELAEVGRRARKCGGAPLGKPRLHLGIGNPVAGTGKASEGNGRDRVLSQTELAAILRALGSDPFLA